MKFILNVDDLKGTRVEKYIQLAAQENSPQIYKPRRGKVNGNVDKFSPSQLEYMYQGATDIINNFGYEELFNQKSNKSS